MKYQVGGAVHASTFIGEFEASSPEEAIEKARNEASVSVCHHCAKSISDPEVTNLWAEDEAGELTQEPTEEGSLRAQLVSAKATIAAAKVMRSTLPSYLCKATETREFDKALAKHEAPTKDSH